MITIRHYRKADAPSVGVLIADTYSEFNLSYAPPKERAKLLGPFHYAVTPAIASVRYRPDSLRADDTGS